MGCMSFPYWLGTFLFDFALYLLTFFFFLLIIFIQKVSYLVNNIYEISAVMFFFGPSLILYSYIFGFFYTKSNNAFKNFPLVNFFVSFSIPFLLNSLLVNYPTASSVMQVFTFSISPFCVLDKGLQMILPDIFLTRGVLFEKSSSYCVIFVL